MLRRDPPAELDPAAVHELEALDAIVEGRALRGEHAALAALVADVRALPEPMSAAFGARLDGRVSEGFRRPRRLPRPRRLLLGALAAATCATVAAVVVTSGDSGTVSKSSSSAPSPTVMSGSPRGSASGGAAIAPAPPTTIPEPLPPVPAPPPTPIPPGETHRVQRAASLTLAAAPDALNRVTDGVSRVTERFGGYVQSSDSGSGDGGQGQATFDLRIPTARLDAAMGELSRLAHVRSRSQNATDVTAAYDAARAALAEARAERQALLRALGSASTPAAIASVRARLRLVAGRIAQDQQNQRRVADSANLSEVSVSVVTDSPAHGAAAGWTLSDALHDAGRVLAVALGVALVVLAALVPLSIAGVIAAFGLAAWRRRRRDAALELA